MLIILSLWLILSLALAVGAAITGEYFLALSGASTVCAVVLIILYELA